MERENHYGYPVFVLCGCDPGRRKLMKAVDPEGHYKSKALLPFLERRLIDWQMDELIKSPHVGEIFLIGLEESDVSFDYPVHFIAAETTSDFGDKLLRGLAYLEERGELPDLIVISTCDAPAIRVDEINTFFEKIEQEGGCEIYISLVPEALAEAEFPKSGRVVARFKDLQVFPGELFALSPRAIRKQQQVISDLGLLRRKLNRQKRKISLMPMLGYLAKRPRIWWTIIKFLLGQATLAEGEQAVSDTFKCKTRGVIIEDAGFGMDMDLPEDYERLEQYVRERKLAEK
ncbi:MAG: hypothetical protein ACOCYU_07410 [Brevefilum sp.]